MNIRQLEAFRSVMLLGSTRAAAASLGITQSAISRLLSHLEAEMELALFTRHKGRLLPRPEAEVLLANASRILDEVRDLQQQSVDLRSGLYQHPPVRVAIPWTLALAFMPGVLERFALDYPRVVVEVLSGDYRYVAQQIDRSRADIGFARATDELRCDFFPVTRSSLICVIPENHPLADERTPLTIAELRNVALILTGRMSESRHIIDTTFRSAGYRPRIAYEVHSVSVACEFVRRGLGVSLASGILVASCPMKGIITRPLVEAEGIEYGLIRSAGTAHSEPVEALMSLMREKLEAAAMRLNSVSEAGG